VNSGVFSLRPFQSYEINYFQKGIYTIERLLHESGYIHLFY